MNMYSIIRAVIIVVVVSLVTIPVRKREQKAREMASNADQNDPFAGEGYVITAVGLYKAIFWFMFILFLALFLFSLGHMCLGWVEKFEPGIGFCIITGCLTALSGWLVSLYCFWKLRLQQTKLIYTTHYLKKKTYYPEDIERIETSGHGKYIVYVNGKRAFSIERDYSDRGLFKLWCEQHNLEIEPQK